MCHVSSLTQKNTTVLNYRNSVVRSIHSMIEESLEIPDFIFKMLRSFKVLESLNCKLQSLKIVLVTIVSQCKLWLSMFCVL